MGTLGLFSWDPHSLCQVTGRAWTLFHLQSPFSPFHHFFILFPFVYYLWCSRYLSFVFSYKSKIKQYPWKQICSSVHSSFLNIYKCIRIPLYISRENPQNDSSEENPAWWVRGHIVTLEMETHKCEAWAHLDHKHLSSVHKNKHQIHVPKFFMKGCWVLSYKLCSEKSSTCVKGCDSRYGNRVPLYPHVNSARLVGSNINNSNT